MKSMIAYCGINCSECPAYIATQTNDDNERKRVAEMWAKQYNPNLTAKDINCDGCTTSSIRVFSWCNECPIRKCGNEKSVNNCAYCVEYAACDKLATFFKMAPKAKDTLDTIRKGKSR
jgi:hypothetical protein